jgi:hypothetical protein
MGLCVKYINVIFRTLPCHSVSLEMFKIQGEGISNKWGIVVCWWGGLYHSQSNTAKADGTDEQEKKMAARNGVAVPARIPTAACRCETFLDWYWVSCHAFLPLVPQS